MSDLVQRAKDLAHRAHAGQVDKAGRPYIEHVARVAAAVSHYMEPEVEAAGWLHDVLEDCPKYVEDFWRFPADVTRAVSTVTRIQGQSPSVYYAKIRRCPLSLAVKLADIADNADESRLALLDDKTAARLRRKYAKAIRALTGSDQPASKSQVKRLRIQGVQATCWVGDRPCEGCDEYMATDGWLFWCLTPGCVYSAELESDPA